VVGGLAMKRDLWRGPDRERAVPYVIWHESGTG
jgi:hypothetical protein